MKFQMPPTYRLAGIVFVFWLLGFQSAQAIPKSQTSPSPAELTVVVSSSEGPIEGVLVSLERRPGSRRLSVTGREGLCRFRGLEPGDYSLLIHLRSHFVAPEIETQLTHVVISPGQKRIFKVDLVKGGVITGRVVNANGVAIVGLPLTALKVKAAPGANVSASPKESNLTALSDDRGEFRIFGLRPGSYAIAVNAERHLFPLKSAATLYYPAQRELANARLFDVFAEQETKALDLVVDLDAGTQNTLSGRVMGPHRAPLAGVFLSLQQISGGYLSDVSSSDGEGYFGFEGLPPGRYLVRAQARQGSYFSVEKEVTIKDFNNTEVTLHLRPYVTVAGNVSLRTKTQIKALSLNLRLGSANAGESIDFSSNKNGSFSAKSGREGLFWWNFPGLAREDYLEKITSNDLDVTHKPLKLDQGLSLEGISIQFAPGAATLGGRIPIEGGCLQYAVYAAGMKTETNEILFIRRADTCIKGSFSIYSVAPGAYYVLALPIVGADKARTSARTMFETIDDYQFRITEKAVAEFKEMGNKPFVFLKERTYQDVVPIIVKLSAGRADGR